jgi:hypothetical protein
MMEWESLFKVTLRKNGGFSPCQRRRKKPTIHKCNITVALEYDDFEDLSIKGIPSPAA